VTADAAALHERLAQLEAELARLRAENATLRAAQVPAQRTDEPHDHRHGWGRQRPPIAEDIA
jgi:ribosomal protein L29